MSNLPAKQIYHDLPRVAHAPDSYTVVINRGSSVGVSLGDTFLIFRLGDDIYDPDTEENLGALEIVLGKVKVTHLQEKMATAASYVRETSGKRIVKRGPGSILSSLYGEEIIESPDSYILPIDAEPGDYTRPI